MSLNHTFPCDKHVYVSTIGTQVLALTIIVIIVSKDGKSSLGLSITTLLSSSYPEQASTMLETVLEII